MIYKKYFQGIFAYGALRKIGYIYNTNYESKKNINNTYEIIKKPILYSDYLFHCSWAGCLTIFYFPVMLLNDMRYLELKIRKLNLKEYRNDYEIDNKDFINVFINPELPYL